MSGETIAMLITCVFGSIVQSITGFGFGSIMMAVMPYFMANYLQVAALSTLCGTSMSAMVALKNFKNANFRVILPLFSGYIVSCAVAVRVSKGFDGETLTKALGAILILVSIYFVFFNNKIKIKPTFKNGVIAGMIGGAGSALFSISGPPTVIYMLAAVEDKDVYRSSMLTFFTMAGVYSTAVRIANGIFTVQMVQLWLMALVALALGAYIGSKIFHMVNADLLKKLIYGYMAVSGITMLI